MTKTLRRLTRLPSIEKDRGIYSWEEFAGVTSYFSSEYFYTIEKHRIPDFLSLPVHLSIEHALETLWNLFFVCAIVLFTRQFASEIGQPYACLIGLRPGS